MTWLLGAGIVASALGALGVGTGGIVVVLGVLAVAAWWEGQTKNS